MHTRKLGAAVIAIGAVAALAGCSGGGGGQGPEGASLTMLIGSSGDAETAAVQAAADAWAEENGAEVEVVAASDLTQELAQGFAGDDAPDVFYMSWDQFATYGANGYLQPYAEDLPNAGDFYPGLVDTFTYDGAFTCAPKDFSTLGLIINTELWADAGLTDADIPTDWDGLEAVATKLTTDDAVGLSFGAEYQRIGVFMGQAGGGLVDDDGTTVTADSPENLAGLEYVQKLYDEGVLRFPADIDAGWSGEALGAGKAAMVIEGPWIKGIEGDFPDTEYAAYELPAGPAGKATFSFTNCWGIPADSDTAEAATSLVEYLTGDEQQLAFADAFGVIPSTEAAAAEYAEKYPENASFVAGAEYAVSPVNFDGAAAVVSDFNSQLGDLGKADGAALLGSLQSNLQAALDEANG
ncbi:sugar ABC transporter substrate-binding protein [Homoserinibacter sp. YIM 151385]|uniref:sugar ABC transporter substrate-binding protein n=1 Tax=Homoserinibacter sp. YIM 151385 TaxID=2985506 RepID=UPI0022F07DDB|nr:extracellular solute-binding protein [Homoserinibacter sp. YIM 151385]WBU37393.1 extracellular solute-binding protein [Homoserinibacter sp. YIM 151385]